jgi:cellulose biosynthesis operon protein BcsF/YhjT
MELTDIVQMISLSAVLFFLLGWFIKSRVQQWFTSLQNYVLKPRYLKPAGFLSNHNHSEQAKKKQ